MAQALDIKDAKQNGELKDLKADIAALRTDFAKLMEDTGEIAKTQRDVGIERGREALSTASEQFKKQKGKVEDSVRDNPLAAIGIAFGVGVLMAAISRR